MRDEDFAFFTVTIASVCLFVLSPTISDTIASQASPYLNVVLQYMLESAERFVGSEIYNAVT